MAFKKKLEPIAVAEEAPTESANVLEQTAPAAPLPEMLPLSTNNVAVALNVLRESRSEAMAKWHAGKMADPVAEHERQRAHRFADSVQLRNAISALEALLGIMEG